MDRYTYGIGSTLRGEMRRSDFRLGQVIAVDWAFHSRFLDRCAGTTMQETDLPRRLPATPVRASAAAADGEVFAGAPAPSDAPNAIGAQQYAPPTYGK